MPRPKKKTEEEVRALTAHYVTIAKAEDHDLAKDCIRLLKDNGIEATVYTHGQQGRERYEVKVEPDRFNEAYIIIEAKITNDGFFDIFQESKIFTQEDRLNEILKDSGFAA